MFPEAIEGLPSWLVVGCLLGVCGTVVVAGAFLAAGRLLPEEPTERKRRTGDSRRRDEIREYLDAIDEHYAENHPVEGRAVAFYLPDRDVAITFDARAYYRIERSEVHAILVEHEMPGWMLGDRLPFATPEVDPGSGDGATGRTGDPCEAAFEELGLSSGATVEEVRTAYRQRVKDVHPDQGGDEDAFRRVREAYATARRHASAGD
ncbi:MAG: J domain-containing protein [Salinirussus sp.]